MEMQGVIEEKSSKSGETNGKTWSRHVFKIGGLTMSTFDDKLNTGFNVGDFVEVIYENQGKYHNIKSMVKKEGQPQINTASNAGAPYQPRVGYSPRDYKGEEATKVAGMLLSYCKDLAVADKIEVSKIGANALILAANLKQVKKELLQEPDNGQE